MGLLKNLSSFRKKQIPILKAIIIFDEDDNVSIEFEKLHPELKSVEYIKIVLHYYAKMLFLLSSSSQSEAFFIQNLLLDSVDNIANTNLKNNPDILKIADINDVIKLSKPKEHCHCYIAMFFGISGLERHITTDMPTKGYLQHLGFSVPVLIHGVLQYLNNKEIETLQLALKWMNGQYRSGVDFGNLKTWESVPASAFFSGIMIDNKKL